MPRDATTVENLYSRKRDCNSASAWSITIANARDYTNWIHRAGRKRIVRLPTASGRTHCDSWPHSARFSAGRAQAYYTAGDRALRPAPTPSHNWKTPLPRPPNYKQEKKRREEQQKKKNEEKQREIAERRKPPADPQPP